MVGIRQDYNFGLQDSRWVNGIAEGQNGSVQGLIANPGGGQANATSIAPAALMVRATTVASANDSLKLPFALRGAMKLIVNTGANSLNLFARNGNNRATGIPDTINGGPNGTAIPIAAGGRLLIFAPAPGIWFTIPAA